MLKLYYIKKRTEKISSVGRNCPAADTHTWAVMCPPGLDGFLLTRRSFLGPTTLAHDFFRPDQPVSSQLKI